MNRKTPMTPEDDVRETPPVLFEPLHSKYRFTLDACATLENAKCERHFTEEGEFVGGQLVNTGVDGLSGNWHSSRVFCNPPFSDIESWVCKAWTSQAEVVVMLVPATRTEQPWWQTWVEPFRDGKADAESLGVWDSFEVEFLSKRTHFLKDGKPIMHWNKKLEKWQKSAPKFGCCLLIWQRVLARD